MDQRDKINGQEWANKIIVGGLFTYRLNWGFGTTLTDTNILHAKIFQFVFTFFDFDFYYF